MAEAAVVAMALQLERPSLNEKMVGFLATPAGVAALCAFVERAGDGGDGFEEDETAARRRSFRAARLLAGADETEGLVSFLDDALAEAAARRLLGCFDARTRGDARHATYVLERLFRAAPDAVYAACLDGFEDAAARDADDAAVALAATIFEETGCDDLIAFDDFADWYTEGGFRVASWLELLDLTKWVL
mmetsp:Transcript_8156/g.24249  ORF Transcript_8156/g.24249 Transcript_8156/m.24249 type:complete len:190 (-) Transcript_8156:24-593(-)